jgi:hypothetical protein
MRGLGPAHHVIDADRLEASLVELGQARLEQPAHGLAALGAEFTALGRLAAAKRRPPGP